MATRCTIKIEGVKYAKIYKHWDGYPKGMLPWLNKFNDNFNKKRGNDPEYKFAQCLRFAERQGNRFNLDMSEYTGWGVIPYDADYFADYEYTLTKDDVKVELITEEAHA
jgi:hypothetical protein